MLKVMIVEDSAPIRQRLLEMLRVSPHVQVVGCAETAAQAVALADATGPDVAVLDVALHAGESSHEVLRHLQRVRPQTQVIVLSNFGWGAMRDTFLRDGARAYFDKALEFRQARDWILERAAQSASPSTADPAPPVSPAPPESHGARRP